MGQNNREIGGYYETRAAEFLIQHGYEILEFNYRTRFGEIDLIAKDGAYLVFIEVKYRSNCKMGFPEEAVNKQKQAKIFRCAQVYFMEHRLSELTPCRFDVVTVFKDKINLWRNAFGGI